MEKRECPHCGKLITPGIRFCPYCGKEVPRSTSRKEYDRNPFDILQVSRDAEQEVIEAAYKGLAKKYHPDTGSAADEERMKEINWAYEALEDKAERSHWRNKSKKLDQEKETGFTSPPRPSAEKETKTRSSSTPPPSTPSSAEKKVGSRFTPGCFVILILLALLFLGSLSNSSGLFSPSPTSRPTRVPTATTHYEAPVWPSNSTPSNPISGYSTQCDRSECIPWYSVNDSYLNTYICVCGEVVKLYQTQQYAQFIRFSNEAGTFLIRGADRYFGDVSVGDLVCFFGPLRRDGNYLYMEVSESGFCGSR